MKELERESKIDKKIQEKTQESYEDAYKKVWKIMGPKGMKCGHEIEKIAREIHGDEILLALPMYRSCACIMKQSKEEKEDGLWRIIAYHDPHWMGEEPNKETLPRFKEEIILHGQRNTVDIIRDEQELTSAELAISMHESQKLWYGMR